MAPHHAMPASFFLLFLVQATVAATSAACSQADGICKQIAATGDEFSLLQVASSAAPLEPSGAAALAPRGGSAAAAAAAVSQATLAKPLPTKVIFVNGPSWMARPSLAKCPVPCTVTSDRTAFRRADAVVWNARWMTPMRPPHRKPRGQRWLFNFDYEAPVYGGHKVAKPLVGKLGPSIDWTMTFFNESDYHLPLGRFAPLEPGTSAPVVNYAAGRTKLLLWFVSNCNGPRLEFFKQLAAALPPGSVDIFGKCGKESECTGRGDEHSACQQKLMSQYKFYAAFENSRCHGYITEKFSRALTSNMVPLALGGNGFGDYEAIGMTRRDVIYVDDFSNVSALASYLKNMDDATYNGYHAWRQTKRYRSGKEDAQQPYCELCQQLHLKPELQKPTRTFGDLVRWFYHGRCLKNGAHLGGAGQGRDPNLGVQGFAKM